MILNKLLQPQFGQFVHVEFDITTGPLICLLKEEFAGCVSEKAFILIPVMVILPWSRPWRGLW